MPPADSLFAPACVNWDYPARVDRPALTAMTPAPFTLALTAARRQVRLAGVGLALLVGTATAFAGLHLYAPAGMPTGRTVTATELWEEFDRVLPPGVWISPLENARYEVISARWMRREFLPSLQRQMKKLWEQDIPEENRAANCNGFALICRVLLNLSAMSARAHGPAAATVIVRHDRPFGGLVPTHEDHSVAFVLTDEGPWIIEVQSGVHTPLRDYPNRDTIKLVSVH